jgi:hypothetical protein
MWIEDRRIARERGQVAAAVRAAELLGKELGMFVDRREQGKPGEFRARKLRRKSKTCSGPEESRKKWPAHSSRPSPAIEQLGVLAARPQICIS